MKSHFLQLSCVIELAKCEHFQPFPLSFLVAKFCASNGISGLERVPADIRHWEKDKKPASADIITIERPLWPTHKERRIGVEERCRLGEEKGVRIIGEVTGTALYRKGVFV